MGLIGKQNIQAGQMFYSSYQHSCSSTSSSIHNQYSNNMENLQTIFRTFCLMKAQVKRRNKANKNIADLFYCKNLLRRLFTLWRQLHQHQRYLQRMHDFVEVYNRRSVCKKVLKGWVLLSNQNTIMITQNKIRIKNNILKKTDLELAKIQKDYEGVIRDLQNLLEKKLIELKKEQQQHRLLHDKYEAMYDRKKFDQEQKDQS